MWQILASANNDNVTTNNGEISNAMSDKGKTRTAPFKCTQKVRRQEMKNRPQINYIL